MGTLCTAKNPLIYGNGDTLHCQKPPHIWRWGHFALPKGPSYMAMGTLCTAKKPLIYGDGDTLHWQKAPHIRRWGHFALPKSPSYMAMEHFALPKSPSYMAMGTLCTAIKPLIYGDGDTLHCQQSPHIWRWGHFALPKIPSYTAMGTPCTAKKPLIYGDGDTLHFQKAPHIRRWGHFALPKSPSYMAMGTPCKRKKPLIYGDGDTLHCQTAPHIWRWGHFALAKSPSYMAMGTLCIAKKPLIYGDGDTLHSQKAPHIRRWGHFALPKKTHKGRKLSRWMTPPRVIAAIAFFHVHAVLHIVRSPCICVQQPASTSMREALLLSTCHLNQPNQAPLCRVLPRAQTPTQRRAEGAPSIRTRPQNTRHHAACTTYPWLLPARCDHTKFTLPVSAQVHTDIKNVQSHLYTGREGAVVPAGGKGGRGGNRSAVAPRTDVSGSRGGT